MTKTSPHTFLLYHDAEAVEKLTFLKAQCWHFAYFHRDAEERAVKMGGTDLVFAERPMPQQKGIYPCMAMGEDALAYLWPHHHIPNQLTGLVCLLTDAKGLAEAQECWGRNGLDG